MLYCIYYFILLDAVHVDARHELVFRARIFTPPKLDFGKCEFSLRVK